VKRPPRNKAGSRSGSKGPAGLVLIGIYRLVEGLFLVAAGIGALRLLKGDYQETLTHWVHELRIDPDNHYIHGMLSRVLNVSPHRLKELSAGTFIYAGLRLTEGLGLIARKRWAEWLTVIATAMFIPIEVWEMMRHFTPVRAGFFVVNALVVAYLIWTIRRK
jgi:uncharacterized membrane protein (DUF2068 family)